MSFFSSSLGREDILARSERFRTHSHFTSFQMQLDEINRGMLLSSNDWKSLAAFAVGGLAYRLGKLSTLTLRSSVFSSAIALLGESLVIRGTETLWEGKNLGEAFELKELLLTTGSMGTLKGFGYLFKNQNLLFRHALQTSALMSVQSMANRGQEGKQTSSTHLENFLEAGIVSLRLEAVNALLPVFLPELSMQERVLDTLVSGKSILLGKGVKNEFVALKLPGIMASATLSQPSTVLVPAQTFVRGSRIPHLSFDDESPLHLVSVSEFGIARDPVSQQTLKAYADQFLGQSYGVIGRNRQGFWHILHRGVNESELQGWIAEKKRFGTFLSIPEKGLFNALHLSVSRVVPDGRKLSSVVNPKHPAVQITWAEALGLADAVGGRLPSEAEREIAARGPLVNLSKQMERERIAFDQFEKFVRGPVLKHRFGEGQYGRYENFVRMDSAGKMLGTEFFTDPHHPQVQTWLRQGELGAWRVFPTSTGYFVEPELWKTENPAQSPLLTRLNENPHPFGLTGLQGQIWEWGNDLHAPYPDLPPGRTLNNPTGADKGDRRIISGGTASLHLPANLRAAVRGSADPRSGLRTVGVRPVFPM